MKKYGLLHIKNNEFLGFNTSSNFDGEFCVDVEYELDWCSNNIWLVDTYEQAEYVRTHNTE